MKRTLAIVLVGVLILSFLLIAAPYAGAQSNVLIFTTLGDYGVDNDNSAAVASMVNNWNPDIILALGDNYHVRVGGVGTEKYDLSTGKYFCNFLKDVTTTGTLCPQGQASINRFFPTLGDHDYSDAGMTDNLPSTYTDYFNLPGVGYTSSSNNERYYDFVYGPVHFFVLNGIDLPAPEPDGLDALSVQAQWLRNQMGVSASTWNVVVLHKPPYSSGTKHGPAEYIQWPFAQWGADVVFSGHEHNYERILRDGIVYFVNGLGGDGMYPFGTPTEGSAFRYNASHGAQRVTVTDQSMTFAFYSIDNGGTLQDTYAITTPHPTSTPTLPLVSTGWYSPSAQSVQNGTGDSNGYELNPTYAFADDGLLAMDVNSGTTPVADCTNSGKDKHKFYNYNLPISASSLIQGIQVRLDAKADSTTGTPKLCATLSWDGGSTWTGWKMSTVLTDSEQTYFLGGTSDTWGRAWTAAELSNATFQVRIADIANNDSTDFSLDWVAVNVTYSSSPTTSASVFTDVPADYWASSFVERLYAAGITGGCGMNPLRYCPEGTVTRAQMAVFLERGIHGSFYPPPDVGDSTGFGDVPPTYWSASFIKQLAAEGITTGCGNGNFCPEYPVTRAQMAVFLLHSRHGAGYAPPAVGNGTGFSDVPPGYWSAAWIKQLVAEGITSGCGNSNYCPENPVTRAQMAVFLVRTFNLP
jgi:hypothetical protein